MKTVPIILRQNGHVHFLGQEASRAHRSHGTVIPDCNEANAIRLVRSGLADLYMPGQPRRSVEWLDRQHPLSRNQIYLRRKAEETWLIQNFMASQTPQ